MSLACDTCPVRDRAACAVLSDEDRADLAKSGNHRTLKRGETLFYAGDDDSVTATLLSGALKVISIDSDGTEHILALVHPAGFVGELFQPFAQHDVVALTDCKLCTFSGPVMDNAVDSKPGLAKALLRRAQEDLHASRELLALTTRQGATEKLAALILALAQAASDSPCHPAAQFDLPLTRGEIANMLGMTIETVSRRLGQLEKDGLIKRSGARGIELIDLARLRALSQ